MKCERAIIQYVDGKPAEYSLVLYGLGTPEKPPIGSTFREAAFKEVPFKEAYNLFPAIRKHWKPDGTAKD